MKSNMYISNEAKNCGEKYRLNDFVGQSDIKKELKKIINNFKLNNFVVNSILLYGPSGLGKETLSRIIANEINGRFVFIDGQTLKTKKQIDKIINNINTNDVVFVKDMNLVKKGIETYLCDIINNNNADHKFVFIGTVTNTNTISETLRSKFFVTFKIGHYSDSELCDIISRYALYIKQNIDSNATMIIAKASRGTPKTAIEYFDKITSINHGNQITVNIANKALFDMMINEKGISWQDYSMMNLMHNLFNNGPVGLKTLAAIIGENPRKIEEEYEPFLLRNGYIIKTNKGRYLTKEGLSLIENL